VEQTNESGPPAEQTKISCSLPALGEHGLAPFINERATVELVDEDIDGNPYLTGMRAIAIEWSFAQPPG